MSQDIVSDALNMLMNASRSGKSEVIISSHSKFLMSVLAIAKLKGYVKDYKLDGRSVIITIGRLNMCKAIKPRLIVKSADIEKYIKRYLPAKNLGTIILSTSNGLMTHQTAQEKNLGGALIAYLY